MRTGSLYRYTPLSATLYLKRDATPTGARDSEGAVRNAATVRLTELSGTHPVGTNTLNDSAIFLKSASLAPQPVCGTCATIVYNLPPDSANTAAE